MHLIILPRIRVGSGCSTKQTTILTPRASPRECHTEEHIRQRIEELECNSQRNSRSNVRQNLNQSSNQALSMRCPCVFSIFIIMTISVCDLHASRWWRRAIVQLTCAGRDSERFTAVWHAHKFDTTIRTTVSSSCAVPLSAQCSPSLFGRVLNRAQT